MTTRVYIPEAFIALNQEIIHHPLLMERLQKHSQKEVEIILAEIAAYCMIHVDGIFIESELAVLADKCLEILKKQRPKEALKISEESWEKLYDRIMEDQARKRGASGKIISIPAMFKAKNRK